MPPAIPPGYRDEPPPQGWPPPPVYTADPFDPANRWYQRAFARRHGDRPFFPPPGDLPFPRLEPLAPADRAELEALLEVVAEGGAPPGAGPLARFLLASDLAWAAARWEAGGEERLGSAAREAAAQLAAPCPQVEEIAVPPPLRRGRWLDAPPAAAPGLQPSPLDRRATRVLHRAAPPGSTPAAEAAAPPSATALLRLRLDPGGRTCRLGSECWLLESRGGEVVPRLFRFDRARSLRGEEPWVEIPPAAEVEILDPEQPGAVRRGPVGALCLGCHPQA